MLLIQPASDGWVFSYKGLPLGHTDTKREAIEAANAHAHDRYSVTGQPMGIFVRMECGDMVLVGRHG